MLLVPLWSTCVYTVDAFLLWGGGYFAQEGALDFSGGYVIHMSAGVSGFVAAWCLGPRLLRDRQHALPNNLVMAAVGAGILWLGWNGFNGGDPYYAGASAAAAVVNTNLATATGVLVWIAMDAWLSKEKKPTFLGGVNGMICGLVGITPCAGWVNGLGAIFVGAICTVVVWIAWNYLSKVRPFSKVDDALGVIYTHGIAGLFGGLLLGIFGDPNMIEYGCGHLTGSGQVIATSQAQYLTAKGTCVPFGVNGLMYTGSAHQLWEQFRAAIWVIFWSALVTFILMKLIGLVLVAPVTRTRSSKSATSLSTARRPSLRRLSPPARTGPSPWPAWTREGAAQRGRRGLSGPRNRYRRRVLGPITQDERRSTNEADRGCPQAVQAR